ncbi:uncharacterized protein A1O9_11234 [Exophiala aquamarina CBS 119918]|uniref:Azaphilone pigments biosynthesis cluster protein L N-terminal domain-containing protein n=1 Tax=Exophiala aquamarina CBS 119918 TaxID=1182545 RepID=A0A072NZI1_9EURO|nr:uncharacterized protein A1O9_11234 [Exophiala aquamarina CBS 119918]KEF52817.1 hypothetical protein A1O9_11234 [Exophiala aquamarina CBS 119918]
MSIVLSSSMDPLSITAGTLAVLQAISTIFQFIGALKEAPTELKDLLDELKSLQMVLHQILKLHDKDSNELSTTTLIINPNLPLKECLLQLERLKKILIPVNRLDRTRKAVAWRLLSLHKGEIKKVLDKIERQKSLLSVSLHAETQNICNGTQSICLQNGRSLSDIREDIARLEYARAFTLYESRPQPSAGASLEPSTHTKRHGAINHDLAPDLAENLEMQEKVDFKTLTKSNKRPGSSRESNQEPDDVKKAGFQPPRNTDRAWTTICQVGSNNNGANVVYGGTQFFSGTVYFGGVR